MRGLNWLNRIRGLVTNTITGLNFWEFFREADYEDGRPFVLKDAYLANAYVNICVEKIAQNIVRAPLRIYDPADREVTSGPVYDLFRDVNSQMSRAQLFEATISWIMMRGESIWVLASKDPGTITGVPGQIYVYDPTFFTAFLDADKTRIVLWKYQRDGAAVPFLPSEIVHFQKWNPRNQFRGVNPLVAQEAELEQDSLIAQSNRTLLRNRSVPSGILSSDQPISETQADGILKQWEKRHGTSSKAGKLGVLGSGTKYQNISMTPEEMQYLKMKQWDRAVILGKYGVPAVVAGFKDDQTPLSGSDTKEQMRFFWDNTLTSHLQFLEDKLRTEFAVRFAPTLKFKFDTSKIPELQEDLYKLAERQQADVAAGLLTQNEVREERGLEPVPWGDEWHIPRMLTPMPDKAPGKASLSVFRKPSYTEVYLTAHWWSVRDKWETQAVLLKKELVSWLEVGRGNVLKEMSHNHSGTSVFNKFNEKYWVDQRARLKGISDNFTAATTEAVTEDIIQVLTDTPIEPKYLEYIQSVFATDDLIPRIADQVFKYVKGAILSGDVDETRKRFRIIQARLSTIAHIEVGRIFNKLRTEAFESVGITHHQWVATKDSKMAINNGEIVAIGEKFSNGCTYPLEIVTDASAHKYEITMPVKSSR